MPERRVPSARPPSQAPSEDIDFKLSPEDSLSDHSNDPYPRTFAVVAAEFKATWDKKLRGRDDKIIQTTQKELDLALHKKETEIASIIHDMEAIHQNFLEQYAILEDKKRQITAAIAEAQQELIPLAVKRHQAIISLGHEVENGQLEGMALIKSACQCPRDIAQELGALRFDC
ncbi:hypothetical protein DEU56DRAFT_752101 [Suillus clintonianus]|uniref:uncharacterized protein n=1 Tax=Suillus clintonianus TaxID=1904413 RepID=UPI001B86C160|nr:uncharacterized protein DEU56DRAFT_752101 [Suillus clintonianus]KAG2152806.1 hypothetical protein DEU56DRAFT_752101 [Suillus clintonianus]